LFAKSHVWSRVGPPGSGPPSPRKDPPLLSRRIIRPRIYCLAAAPTWAISPYADKTEPNGTHTRARALSPGPPWPTRVCSQPIRDGRGGFAATLARCAQLASGRHVTPPGAWGRSRVGAPDAKRAPFCLFFAPPRSHPSRRGPRPPARQLGRPPPLRRGPAGQGVRRSRGRCQQRCRRAHSRTVARPLLWPAPSRPHAPRPPSAVQPSPPQRPSPGTGPVRLYTDSPTTLGSTDVVQSFTFPKTARGDAIYYGGGPCHVFSPYNVGRILSQDGDLVTFSMKSHVGSRAVLLPAASRPPRGPRQCRQLIPVLDMEDSRLQWRWAQIGD
jgi:hypothetical protein